MNETKRKGILKKLNLEIKKAQKMSQKRTEAAKQFASASRSQQGDRLYFEDAHHLARNYLSRLLELKKEILSTPKTVPKSVKSVTFVSLEYQGGKTDDLYFVKTSVHLADLQLLSSKSPLGKAISGKKEGSRFSYQIEKDGQTISLSGRIKKVE